MASDPPLLDMDDMLTSWMRQLRGERKSQHTLTGYRNAITGYLDWCSEEGRSRDLTRDNVADYLAAFSGAASTARLHVTVIRLFARWLESEEGFDASRIVTLRPPKLDDSSVPDLSDDELARMLKACEGRTFADRRDRALLAMFAETGLRAAEMVAIDVTDVDVDQCVMHVRRGKGGKGRRVHFSAGCAAAMDRYLRARRTVTKLPAVQPLWLNARGGRLGYTGMVSALKGRAADAGVTGFHLHRLRHSTAVRWMRKGGSEVGLMAHAGWASNAMVARYVKAASEQLAGDEFKRLDLGVVDS